MESPYNHIRDGRYRSRWVFTSSVRSAFLHLQYYYEMALATRVCGVEWSPDESNEKIKLVKLLLFSHLHCIFWVVTGCWGIIM